MRPGTLILVILSVIFTACSGSPTAVLPTSAVLPGNTPPEAGTPAAPTADPNAPALATTAPLVDSQGQLLAITLPAPGTIIPALTEDPEIGLIFDVLNYTRTGGITGQPINIQLRQDGTLVRDGVTSSIGTAEVQRIDGLLDAVNFFGIQGIFFSMRGASPDTYRYTLGVERNGSSAMITADDGLTPPELLNLFAELNVLGR